MCHNLTLKYLFVIICNKWQISKDDEKKEIKSNNDLGNFGE